MNCKTFFPKPCMQGKSHHTVSQWNRQTHCCQKPQESQADTLLSEATGKQGRHTAVRSHRKARQTHCRQKPQESKADTGGEKSIPPALLAPLLPRSGLPFLRALLCPSAEAPLALVELLALLVLLASEGLRWVWYSAWAPGPLIRLASSSSCFTDLIWDNNGTAMIQQRSQYLGQQWDNNDSVTVTVSGATMGQQWFSNSHSIWDNNGTAMIQQQSQYLGQQWSRCLKQPC